jgi:SAM-dependent methyltransferase
MATSVWRSGLLRVLDHFDMRVTARKQYDLAKYCLDVPGVFHDRASRRRGAPDGLPWPPPELIHLVVGRYALENFFEEGAALASVIKNVLKRQSINLTDLQSLLDFGCGCGRVTRHWATLRARVHGCDYNARLVEWCRRSLPLADFEKNELAPPLPYLPRRSISYMRSPSSPIFQSPCNVRGSWNSTECFDPRATSF